MAEIAKMGIFAQLQIIERIPELRFRYVGSYPSDKELRLAIIAIINSALRNGIGEHWIIIAQMDKTYYFADSLGTKRSTYSFLRKKFWQRIPQKLQKN